ncbi:glycerate kinase [Flagellimonas eckloniae]|uniref:Glycerate kinase n=1 Tax=Flagellimonas eckloniae TaxID=346185 RepID=A0A0Q0WXW8_9FLAO|nr:glycerate kinase [Allomuricauda eckloniae]KQC30335.1 glycerate kinase [Allomuricauda eckloniae]
MKFVIAPDKYKGSLSGREFCEAVDSGIKMVFPNALVIKKPLADGGDGTLEVVKDYLNASEVKIVVNDPLFRKIEAKYLLSKDKKTAYIEMSEASGYALLNKDEMNCMHTSSLGTGELIADALKNGVKAIILGIGGSATNDGGMGTAVALGYKFLDEYGNELKPIGENLIKVKEIDTSRIISILSDVEIKVACDVANPFYGENGAAKIYGPQKGASKEEVEFLDEGLRNLADVMKTTFDIDVQKIAGAGAAGGMGGGAMVFLDANLTSGIDLIMELANFKNTIEDADWIITGEGQLDHQTISGKTITGVLKSAKSKNVPVAALCGSVDVSINEIQEMGLDYAVSILNKIHDWEEAKASSHKNLEQAAYNFANLLKISKH